MIKVWHLVDIWEQASICLVLWETGGQYIEELGAWEAVLVYNL